MPRRIELTTTSPDGEKNWIDIRETIKGGDIMAVGDAAVVKLDADGRATEMSFAKVENDQFAALAQRLITAWSFPVPLPGTAETAKSVISDLEEEDYWRLRDELQPVLDRLKGGRRTDPKSGDVRADAVVSRQAPEAEG
jgi:malate synthase